MNRITFSILVFPFFLFAQITDPGSTVRIEDLLVKLEKQEAREDYQKMLDTAVFSVQYSEKYFGKKSKKYAQCQMLQGVAFSGLEDYKMADSILHQANDLIIDLADTTGILYAKSCYHLADLYLQTDRYDQAVRSSQRAIEIFEKTEDKNSDNFINAIERLGVIYLYNSQHHLADSLLEESRSLREKRKEKETIGYAINLFYLGMLKNNSGQHQEAENLLLEAIAIFDQHPDAPSGSYLELLNVLGDVYLLTGRYGKAEAIYQKNLYATGQNNGKKSLAYASALDRMAHVYSKLGRLENAETLNLEALKIKEQEAGKVSIDYMVGLNNLAIVYLRLADFERGENMLVETRQILTQLVSKEHWYYSQVSITLATVYKERKKYAAAEQLYLEVKALQDANPGEDHQRNAINLLNLGKLYFVMKRFEEAENRLNEARSIYENHISREHLDYAVCLQTLGIIHAIAGRYQTAETLLLEVKNIQEKVGSNLMALSGTLEELARLYTATQNQAKADSFFTQYAGINQKLQLERSAHFSNQEIHTYQMLFDRSDDLLNSAATSSASPRLQQLAYDHALYKKGFLLENSLIRENLVKESSAEIQEIHAQWKGQLRQLAKAYSQPGSDTAVLVVELETQSQDLEKQLLQSIKGFGKTRQTVSWEAVRDQLPPQSVAIEFIHHQYYNPFQTDSVVYSALVIQPGTDAPVLIPLFEEKELKKLLHLNGQSKLDFLNNLYQFQPTTATSLHQLIWTPLAAHLGEIQTIYFSPSGLLHRINFGAIAINEEKRLADRFILIQLGSTRHLVESDVNDIEPKDACLFGDIQYNLEKTEAASPATISGEEFSSRSRGELQSFLSKTDQLRGDNWAPLTWTAVEVEGITEILKDAGIATRVETGPDANEETFRLLAQGSASPEILHLATHGYFFPDSNAEKAKTASKDSAVIFSSSSHPMIRSGLILAGANRAWSGQEVEQGQEDGILTAYEISQLNLSNTKLVVLSACETGLGDIDGNEGVYGLQRAFKIAGVQYIIMSLWQVPDFQTQELMTSFYIEWLEKKKSVPEAFQAAQAEMRERYPAPFRWAGFVLVE